MEFLKAVLLGIVEGVTEWLPISSTGHMILVDEFLQLHASAAFMEMFFAVIQLGAILAVVLLFWGQIFPFGKRNNPHPLRKTGWGAYIKCDIWVLWFKILVACVPAAVVGLLWEDTFNRLFYNYTSVSIALIVFGIGFLLIERYNRGRRPSITRISDLSYRMALAIGLFQLLAAIFPGTSRSGATILGALLLGISRTVAAEFTFYLAVPVMCGASLLKLVKFGLTFTGTELGLLLTGCVTAFVVSVAVIRFLLSYIRRNDFTVFGWYRIALGTTVLLYFHFAG